MKRLNLWLLAALLCGMSMSVTSCKDDDSDSNNSSETAEMEALENANTFWGVAGNLVGTVDATADYEDKTFEPTIGEPLDGDDAVRVVILPDVEAAAAHFAAIVDADVTENTSSYTYQNDAVGRLTYTKSTDGKSLATVDVDIRQIPHLQKIVYRTADQMGTNAITDGIPYYSFGDVIKRHRDDGVDEYWVCIQAPFTPQGSTDVVWATLSPLPDKNIYTYTSKTNDETYRLPTGIGNNKEYMKNLAELIYAITETDKWLGNMEKGPANMKAFNLVKKENARYLNETFWKRVKYDWTKEKLAKKVFDTSLTVLNLMIKDEGLKLVYNGYKWWFLISNKLTLWVSTITCGQGLEANARHLEWKPAVEKNVIDPIIQVDCVNQTGIGSKWINKAFFGDVQPRYIFRFATTRELAGKNVSIYDSLADPLDDQNNIEDVYFYTGSNIILTGQDQTMENYAIE